MITPCRRRLRHMLPHAFFAATPASRRFFRHGEYREHHTTPELRQNRMPADAAFSLIFLLPATMLR